MISDLNVALGIQNDDCTTEKVNFRKLSINTKVRKGGHIILSKVRESDKFRISRQFAGIILNS